jgi:polyphosphate kinase
MALSQEIDRPDLKDLPLQARVLEMPESGHDALFDLIREGDILLHHPYESFGTVTDFIARAAEDPKVLAIKQTFYRTSGDSPIARALILAAEKGKQVTVLMELKARFDEENNIHWAREMEEAGIHVVYGLVGYKTHCKLALVVRREGGAFRRYAHLGTGNYNPTTARLYTDLGLLTCRESIGRDVASVFNLLTGFTGLDAVPRMESLLVAPLQLKEGILQRLRREEENARAGKPARVVAKMNALVDAEVITGLYQASQAGVSIDLIVRGICCLRPGLPGISDNIRVRSIVDRFLEHSRVYYFENGGQPELWAGSADWMPRNFQRRVEVLYPILEPAQRRRVIAEILALGLHDNVKARVMQPDGSWTRCLAQSPALRSQALLMDPALIPDPSALELPALNPIHAEAS